LKALHSAAESRGAHDCATALSRLKRDRFLSPTVFVTDTVTIIDNCPCFRYVTVTGARLFSLSLA